MTKYVALLRGIGPSNPNMHGPRLCSVLESLGYQNVSSLLGSGNVLFESPNSDTTAMEAQLEKAWPAKLGFNSLTIIRSQADLQQMVAKDPYKGQAHDQNKTYLLVTFFKRPTKIPFSLPHQPADKPFTILAKRDNAIFGSVNISTGKTPDYMAWLERQFGKDITSRTWLTIHRILKKMNQAKQS